MFAIWDNSFYRYFELPSDLLHHAVGPGDWQSIFDAWMIRMVMCSYYCSQMIKLSAMRYENCALLCCKQHDSEHTVEVPQYSAHPCVRVCVCVWVCMNIYSVISFRKLKVPVITSLNYDGCSFVFTFNFRHSSCSLTISALITMCVCVCTFLPFNHYIEERGTGSICVLFHYKHRFNRFFSSVLPAIC